MLDPAANAILIRRRRTLLLPQGAAETAATSPTVDPGLLATLLKNLEYLGFTLSGTALERLTQLPGKQLLEVYEDLVGLLRREVAAHVDWAPMYPNFPQQVMDAPEAELYLNALIHYLGKAVGLRLLPDYVTHDRPALADSLTATPLELAAEHDLKTIARNLMAAKTSLSDTDKADLWVLVERYTDVLPELLPERFEHKENLAYTASLVIDHPVADALLTRYFTHATDVLRLAAALSNGDVSLATPTRFVSFSRRRRRLLLALLERCETPLVDMVRRTEMFKRLGERLHPGEYRKRFPKCAEAFDAIRQPGSLPSGTFASRVELALAEGDVDTALELLRQKPGELARRLDHLCRIAAAPEAITKVFTRVAKRVSTPVLLQVMAHFRARYDAALRRAFFPKGSVAKLFVTRDRRPPVADPIADALVATCRQILLARFGKLKPLGRVYVDRRLRHHLVPFSQRSASRALNTWTRGSSVALPDGDTVRFFLWWKDIPADHDFDGIDDCEVDLDLSAVMYDPRWNYKEHISYTHLKSSDYQAAHSGDITSAPYGACEFIDIHLPSLVAHGGRYVVMTVLSYSRQPLNVLPECFGGWMMRREPGSGEIFEPRTVADRIDLTATTSVAIPCILDAVERRMLWTDIAMTSKPRWQINVEANQRGMSQIGSAMVELGRIRPTLYDLFSLHARARGSLVEDPVDADRVFSLDAGVTPFDVDIIAADFL